MKYIAQPELMRLVKLYRKNWKLFLLSVVACIGLAGAYLLIKNPTFMVTASVMIKEDSGGGGVDMSSMASSMMRGFAYGDLLGMGGGAVDDEIVVLSSYSNVYSAIRSEQLNIQYTRRPFLRKKHYFRDTPLTLTPARPEMADTLSVPIIFKVKVRKDGTIRARVRTYIKRRRHTLAKIDQGHFPLVIETEMGTFTLDSTAFLKPNKSMRMTIVYSDYASTTEQYLKKFDTDFASKKSDVIFLNYSDANKVRGKAFLTAVIDEYNKYSLKEKNADAQRMSTFLSKRLEVIQNELLTQDQQMEDFKKANNLTDLKTEMKVILERSGNVKEKRMAAEQQMAIIKTTEQFINEPDNKYTPIPLNICMTNGEMAAVLASYNNLLGERQILLRSTHEDNPAVTRLDDRISMMRQSLLTTLSNLHKVAERSLKEIYEDENEIFGKIGNVPLIEREYLGLERQAEVTNTLYLYLLHQQAQNDIKLQSDAPVTQIVDQAYTSVLPTSPKPKLILAAALLMGLFLPVVYLRAKRATKKNVDNAFELSQLIEDTPIYQLHDSKPEDMQQPVDDAYLNDIRNLRSEIDWSASRKDEGKVIVVAGMERSTGKSKAAYHIARSIAGTQRRVLLIDADLRNSQLGATPLGHTERNRTLVPMLEQHITSPDAAKLFVPDATVPYLQMLPATDGLQNPVPAADLLQSPQWNDLLAWARINYDAVIIDTTALDRYPDTLPLLQQADSNYFVFAAGSATKLAVDQLKTLVANDQTRDLHLILNVNAL